MNKYQKLMWEIIQFLDGTWLSRAGHPALRDRGPIRGSSFFAIMKTEGEIGKKLPPALKAWYLIAGEVPPYLYDYDADHSLEDLRRSQETASLLTQDEACEWELSSHIIPFTQRIGEQFFFVNTGEGNPDDPPVFHYMEGHAQPRPASVAFTTYLREVWLGWLDFPSRGKEISREISTWQQRGYSDWMVRKRILDTLWDEVMQFRRQLIETVHQEDLTRNEITGPRAFQERWLRVFPSSEIGQKLQKEAMEMPFGWVDPPGKLRPPRK